MFLSIKNYAAHVNLGEAFIRSLVATEQLPSIMVGVRKRKINVEEADKIIVKIKCVAKRKKNDSVKLSFKERLALLRQGVQQ